MPIAPKKAPKVSLRQMQKRLRAVINHNTALAQYARKCSEDLQQIHAISMQGWFRGKRMKLIEKISVPHTVEPEVKTAEDNDAVTS